MRLIWLMMIVSVLSLAGCGLAEYQARMDIERKRMKLFDEEDKALEAPIKPPMRVGKDKKEVPAWPGYEPFVRPPKEHDNEESDFTLGGTVHLFRYAGPKGGYNFFVAASKVGQPNAEGLYNEHELSVDEFKTRVLQALKEYYRKEYKGFDLQANLVRPDDPQDAKGIKVEKVTVQPEAARSDPAAIMYEKLSIPDRRKEMEKEKGKEQPITHFLVYFHNKGNRQAALIYQFPKKELGSPEYEFKLDYSLKSLDLAFESAVQKRQDFQAQRKNAPPAPSKKSEKSDAKKG